MYTYGLVKRTTTSTTDGGRHTATTLALPIPPQRKVDYIWCGICAKCAWGWICERIRTHPSIYIYRLVQWRHDVQKHRRRVARERDKSAGWLAILPSLLCPRISPHAHTIRTKHFHKHEPFCCTNAWYTQYIYKYILFMLRRLFAQCVYTI